MIERRPIANLFGHLMLIIGIIIVAFPIYYTFIASSMTSAEILRPPISLLPAAIWLRTTRAPCPVAWSALRA